MKLKVTAKFHNKTAPPLDLLFQQQHSIIEKSMYKICILGSMIFAMRLPETQHPPTFLFRKVFNVPSACANNMVDSFLFELLYMQLNDLRCCLQMSLKLKINLNKINNSRHTS